MGGPCKVQGPPIRGVIQGGNMSKSNTLARLLLSSAAVLLPAAVSAQTGGQAGGQTGGQGGGVIPNDQTGLPTTEGTAPPDVSVPGGSLQNDTGAGNDIVVTGRRNTNPSRSSTQVVSVLSTADIQRTGEGNIAGSLSRITGLSVVGNGFVYVRGLGDRYSLALLNGSPLPSPEPLRRVVPLDIFPTTVIASALVQKTYSVNFPGEYGGGVINLTTITAPTKSFLASSAGVGLDTETTARLGYTYYGSRSDYSGFDNGQRNLPPALQSYLRSGARISQGGVDTQTIARQLVDGRNSVIQRNSQLPVNWSGNLTGGTSFDIGGDTRVGLIATAGYSNAWRTRDTTQQTALTADLSQTDLNFERIVTDDRTVVNGLGGISVEAPDYKMRFTGLYIRDTVKQARLGVGTRSQSGLATLQQQDTAWFARQLIDSQFAGEFKPFPKFELDLRFSYANSKRQSPDEFSYEYSRSNNANDPFGGFFINRLNNGQRGNAQVSYSNLNEDLYSAGIDLSYKILPKVTATIGSAFQDTNRKTERRDFLFLAPGNLPDGVALLRPDLLLGPAVIDAFKIALIDNNEGNPVFRGKLRTYAGYGQIQADITSKLSLNAGVRYETARQSVDPVQVFTTPTVSAASTLLNRNYFLPAATLTYQVIPDVQLRLNASKTIARPQFRELIFQRFYDPDTNRNYQGNPLLTDSQLYNGEGRLEWYFAKDQRIAVAGFYKRIERPIETYASVTANDITSSFVNAPRANLYGGEIDTQKYFDLDRLGEFFTRTRLVAIANYTFTKSKIIVRPTDAAASLLSPGAVLASNYIRNGVPLTGQSDHIANIQLGLEAKDHLSQQTILLNYASRRVTNRGASGQPDIYEYPGFRLDFVAREAVLFVGLNTEVKFEVRNITGTKYQEYQQLGANRIFYNRYRVGTSAFVSVGIKY